MKVTVSNTRSILTPVSNNKGDKKAVLGKDVVKDNPLFTAEQSLELFDVFECFCDPRSKTLRMKDLVHAIVNLGLADKNPTLMGIIRSIESDFGDNGIDFDTFLSEITRRLGNPGSADGRRTIFNIVDMEGKGAISFENLKQLAREIGYNISDNEIQEVIQSISPNGEGIRFEDYERHMSRKYDDL